MCTSALHKARIFDPFSGRDAAIRRLSDREDLYNKYVERFKRGYSDSDGVLLHLIESKKYDEALVFAHSIKGLAATLGMDDLSLSSKEIEFAIKEGRYDDLPLLLSLFENALSQVMVS